MKNKIKFNTRFLKYEFQLLSINKYYMYEDAIHICTGNVWKLIILNIEFAITIKFDKPKIYEEMKVMYQRIKS